MLIILATINLIATLLGIYLLIRIVMTVEEFDIKKLVPTKRNVTDFPTGKLELCPVCKTLSDSIQRVPSGHLACKNCRIVTFNLTA